MKQPHLVWVYPVAIATALDSATWLQTSQALRQLGWRVTLIGVGPAGYHTVNGVETFCIPTIQKYFLGQAIFHLRVIFFLIRCWRTVDVVLFHQLSLPWLLPLKLYRWLRRGLRPLFVMDTRDLNVVENNWRNRLRSRYFALTHRLANRWADGQTAITPRMADLVKIPPQQRYGYWPSGVSVEKYAHLRAERRWPQDGEPIHLLYIGKLHEERNLLPLCHAVEQLNGGKPSFILTFVGAGPEQLSLQKAAAASEGRLRVLPPVSHEQIPTYLREAHIGVTSLPNPDNRKFEASSPIKLFEYMAAALPVLATKNACYTDVVGTAAYVFWAEDADIAGLVATLAEIRAAVTELAGRGDSALAAADAWSWHAAGCKLDQALRTRLAHLSYLS